MLSALPTPSYNFITTPKSSRKGVRLAGTARQAQPGLLKGKNSAVHLHLQPLIYPVLFTTIYNDLINLINMENAPPPFLYMDLYMNGRICEQL